MLGALHLGHLHCRGAEGSLWPELQNNFFWSGHAHQSSLTARPGRLVLLHFQLLSFVATYIESFKTFVEGKECQKSLKHNSRLKTSCRII